MVYVPRGPGGGPPGTSNGPARVNAYKSAIGVSSPAANGTTSIVFPQVEQGYRWLINRVAITCDSTSSTQAELYDGDPVPTSLLSRSRDGNLDYDDADTPYVVDTGKLLRIVWTGCSDGSVATARIQFQLVST